MTTNPIQPPPAEVCGLPVVALAMIPDAPGLAPGRCVVVCKDAGALLIVWSVHPEKYRQCDGCGRQDAALDDHPGDHPQLIFERVRWRAERGRYGIADYGRALDVMTSRATGAL